MKHLRIWLALLAGMAMAKTQGQSLPLEQLHKLSTLPQGLPLAKMTTVLLPVGWTYQGHLDMSPEVYWTTELMATDSLDGETPESWLSLRPMPGNLTDVLFKTQLARNFEPLRRELKRMKIEPTPVYCLEGKGERYETAFYSLTLYSGKKGQYRYIAVLHPIPVPSPMAPAAPAAVAEPAPVLPSSTIVSTTSP
ncbi:hypothetical protein [Hymenobacter guriensis]|uniref:DUF1795 domain-containing protein n=1 Tax=Hymenobacter guriensis TaxID=2793065 RepID=A0ABS0L847_9BACT|nr:hypothetical protein [Hymenobacter guriensis]MBG8556330.1 hypothetical protein [Hymenobacter guriensis]